MKAFIISGAAALFATAASADSKPMEKSDPAASPQSLEAQGTPTYAAPSADVSAQMAPMDVATKEDARKLAESEFLRADRNVDGAVDKLEFSQFAAESATSPADDLASIDKAFAKIATGDDKISLEEMTKARMKSFDAADANRDFALDAKERTKFAALISASAPVAAKTQ